MAFYKGCIYALTTGGDLYAHEISMDNHVLEPRVCRITPVIMMKDTLGGSSAFYGGANAASYLVASCTGKLLMVKRTVPWEYCHANQFGKAIKVFEADFRNSRWLEVQSIGDQVLFVSPTCSRAIRASDCGNSIRASMIYILHDEKYNPYRLKDHLMCGMYNMCTKTICPISVGELHVSDVMNAAWYFPWFGSSFRIIPGVLVKLC